MLTWIWLGLRTIGYSFQHVVLKAVSLLHTSLAAVFSFFRHATFQDIWNGFCSLVHNILVAFPKNLWRWLQEFEHSSYKFMSMVFGQPRRMVSLFCGVEATRLLSDMYHLTVSSPDCFNAGETR